MKIGGAYSNLLDGLVYDESLGVLVDHPEAVAVDVESGADRLAGGALGENDRGLIFRTFHEEEISYLEDLESLLACLHSSGLEHLAASKVLKKVKS